MLSQRETPRQIISPNRLCPVELTATHPPIPFTISLTEPPPFMPLVSGRPSFPPSGTEWALSLSLASLDDMGRWKRGGRGRPPNSNMTVRWMPQVTSFCLRMKYAGKTVGFGGGFKAKGSCLFPHHSSIWEQKRSTGLNLLLVLCMHAFICFTAKAQETNDLPHATQYNTTKTVLKFWITGREIIWN